MVDSVNPNYYAASVLTKDYILVGGGFNDIPSNAKGILAFSNDNPLGEIETNDPFRLFSISQKSNFQITLSPDARVTHTADTYLGAIVSEDRQTIYWTNNTNPLP